MRINARSITRLIDVKVEADGRSLLYCIII